ncbi:YqaJ viral recombinase family protein, partial [bacterium]|nr:YqaJ viral recombinase family protein [bacterium]
MSDRATWLAARRKGIGGSDAAAVAGVSPWSTALDVYLDKLGEAGEVEETVHMRRGTLMEPVVRQLYADETGRSVETSREIVQNPRYPYALANLDGIASGDRILECKSSLSRVGWGDPGTGVVPVYCLCQVQHYMMVTELEVADVAVIFGDFEFCIYPVEADLEFQELLAACEHQFWG